MRRSSTWLVLCLVVLLQSVALGDDVLPKVAPGRSIYIDFPKLPKMRDGKTTRMEVRVPANYDKNKSYPLLAWMGGGKGGYRVSSGLKLADANKFILIGLPYPQGANDPGQSNKVGQFETIWGYHKAMLDTLEKVVPNINPELRVAAGFSNGGHAIDGMLGIRSRRVPPYGSYFTTFIMADGGTGVGDYRSVRGRHLFICWGVKGNTNRAYCQSIAKKAKSSGVYVKAVEMSDAGHQFPEKYMGQAKEWLSQTVIPHTIHTGSRQLRSMISRRRYADAIKVGRGLIELGASDKQKTQIEKTLADIDTKGKAAFVNLRIDPDKEMTDGARKAAIRRVDAFIKLWSGTSAENQGRELLEQLENKSE